MTAASPAPARSMRRFLALWTGELLSSLGSAVARFALGVWVLEHTGSVTSFALVAACASAPPILLGARAGAFADRHDRRWAMLLGNALAASFTAAVAIALYLGATSVWIVYAGVFLGSCASAFHRPAYLASVSTLVDDRHLGRASGLLELELNAGSLVGPALGGLLITRWGLSGVLVIDVASFLAALVPLAFMRIPAPERWPGSDPARDGSWSPVMGHLRARPALLRLLVFVAVFDIGLGLVSVLATPLILALASPMTLGLVLSITGLGAVLGTLVMIVWGGPSRSGPVLLGAGIAWGAGLVVLGLRPSLWLITAGGLVLAFTWPVFGTCAQAIWRRGVAPSLQGRLYSLLAMQSQVVVLATFLLAGPLSEHLFEPLLGERGALAGTAGRLVGTGTGRGIGLLLVLTGAATCLAAWRLLGRAATSPPPPPPQSPPPSPLPG